MSEDVPELMVGLGERLLGRREEIDGGQMEVDVDDAE